jgi:dUTPase
MGFAMKRPLFGIRHARTNLWFGGFNNSGEVLWVIEDFARGMPEDHARAQQLLLEIHDKDHLNPEPIRDPYMFATVRFAKNHPLAQTPTKGSEGAAAFDLVSADVKIEGDHIVVNTGLNTAFEQGYVLLVFGRSGYARKHGIHLANGVAVIDSDYRGDIQLIFRRGNDISMADAVDLLSPGNRVAQAMLVPLPITHWEETSILDSTTRGEGGFGSTGTR